MNTKDTSLKGLVVASREDQAGYSHEYLTGAHWPHTIASASNACFPNLRMTTPRQRRVASRENWFGEAGSEELGNV